MPCFVSFTMDGDAKYSQPMRFRDGRQPPADAQSKPATDKVQGDRGKIILFFLMESDVTSME